MNYEENTVTQQLTHIYAVENNKLVSYSVIDQRGDVVTAVDKAKRTFRVDLECSEDFFRTPKQAMTQGYKDLQECVACAREDYQDALASYRVARRLGKITPEEYFARVTC